MSYEYRISRIRRDTPPEVNEVDVTFLEGDYKDVTFAIAEDEPDQTFNLFVSTTNLGKKTFKFEDAQELDKVVIEMNKDLKIKADKDGKEVRDTLKKTK